MRIVLVTDGRTKALLSLIAFVVLCLPAHAQPPDEASALPFVSSDQIVIRKAGSQRAKTMSGVIEDLSGQTVVLRRAGNTVDVFNLRDVVSLRFQKSPEFDEGLRRIRARNWKGAVTALQAAANSEPRKWVSREIRASLANAQRGIGQLNVCLETIERILKDDADSRHVVELPLVWDERLPAEHRISMAVADLKSESLARQLAAASALLQDLQHQTASIATLQSLKKNAHGRLRDLAEMQLWRVPLLRPDELRSSDIASWNQQVRFLDRRTRSGAEFIIGRALLATHDYDNAATSLLWVPFLEPLDPPTTAASLTDAITALNLAGRTAEAARLRIELSDQTANHIDEKPPR